MDGGPFAPSTQEGGLTSYPAACAGGPPHPHRPTPTGLHATGCRREIRHIRHGVAVNSTATEDASSGRPAGPPISKAGRQKVDRLCGRRSLRRTVRQTRPVRHGP